MRTVSKYTKTVFLLVSLLLSCAMTAQADNTACAGAIFLVPDGSLHQGSFTAQGQDRWYRFVVKANRSYAVMIEDLSPSDTLPFVVFSQVFGGSCQDLTPFPSNGIFQVEPVNGAVQGSFSVQPLVNTELFFPVNSDGASSGNFRLRVEETTLFNPRWSTFGGFHTEFGFLNTTNTAMVGTLTLFNNFGAVITTSFLTISVNGTAFRDTRPVAVVGPEGLNVADNQKGSALFTHNGPPGAILADSFIVHPGFPTGPFVVPGKFETARQMR